MINDKTVQMLLTLVIAAAALNWGLVEFFNYNVLTDGLLLAEGDTDYKAVVGGIAVAAALRTYSVVEWVFSDG